MKDAEHGKKPFCFKLMMNPTKFLENLFEKERTVAASSLHDYNDWIRLLSPLVASVVNDSFGSSSVSFGPLISSSRDQIKYSKELSFS